MSSIPSNLSRISTQLQSNLLLSNTRNTQTDLLEIQQQISTGYRVVRPSDDPGASGSIVNLNKVLNRYTQQLGNMDQAQAVMDNTDLAMSDILDVLLEAQSIASSQVGAGSTAETRAAEADVVDAQLDALLTIANREYLDIFLFSGTRSNQAPFVATDNGIEYIGATSDLQADLGALSDLGVNTNGADALGALSERMVSAVDLDPQATADTRIVDVSGARGLGVVRGEVTVDVDGTEVTVDLTTADTLGDVVTRINDAINSVDPTAGSLGISGPGYALTANAGHTIAIVDIGTATTAADLGIDLTATATTAAGGDLDPRLTDLTTLASLGTAVDFASGLKITNGAVTKVVDLSAAVTVQDMIAAVEAADIGVRLSISDDARGLSLVNQVSGTTMSIGENAGGTTASDLGLRTFETTTALADLNFGEGVRIENGEDDFRIHLHDGTQVDVNLDGAATVQDVLDAINTAGGGAVSAALAADGNGIVLTDATVGADPFRVVALNASFAAQDLGLQKNAQAGATIAGDDVAQERVESIFTHILMLRDALASNDSQAITEAGAKIEADFDAMANVRAQVGVRAKRVEDMTNRTEDMKLQAENLLSGLRDADLTEAITRFSQLEMQLQANYQASSMLMGLSLLDFLR